MVLSLLISSRIVSKSKKLNCMLHIQTQFLKLGSLTKLEIDLVDIFNVNIKVN